MLRDVPICFSGRSGSCIAADGDATASWGLPAGLKRLGKYELITEVGSGAFGTVYKARDADDQPLKMRVVLDRVTPGSVADKLGMKVGDEIVSLDGRPVTSFADMSYRRNTAPAGIGALPMTLRRGEQEYTVSVPPGTLGVNMTDVPPKRK